MVGGSVDLSNAALNISHRLTENMCAFGLVFCVRTAAVHKHICQFYSCRENILFYYYRYGDSNTKLHCNIFQLPAHKLGCWLVAPPNTQYVGQCVCNERFVQRNVIDSGLLYTYIQCQLKISWISWKIQKDVMIIIGLDCCGKTIHWIHFEKKNTE